MKNEVGTISAAEFAAAEQLLKDEDPEECRNEDVRGMLEVFEGLTNTEEAALPYGHTIDTYRRENSRMKELLQQGDALAQKPFMLNPWLEPEKSTLSGDTKLKSLLLRFPLLKADRQNKRTYRCVLEESSRNISIFVNHILEKRIIFSCL